MENRNEPEEVTMSQTSAITGTEVAHLADLARIALTEDEKTALTGDLNAILASVARVQEVAGPEVPATSHPLPLANVMRPDTVGETLGAEAALAAAPASEDDKFLVPQILGEE